MKYYGLIKNDCGEWVVYTQNPDRSTVNHVMAALRKCGFTDDQIKVVRATDRETLIAHDIISVTMVDGEIKEYPIHSANIRREFLVYCQMALNQKEKTVAAVELQDLCHHTLYRFELGKLMVPKLPNFNRMQEASHLAANTAFIRDMNATRRRVYARLNN